MSTLFTWVSLLLLQILPGMYLPNSHPNNTITHCAPKTTAPGNTCSDTSTLVHNCYTQFHNTPITYCGSWHPLSTLITLFHHIKEHYIHHWHRQRLALLSCDIHLICNSHHHIIHTIMSPSFICYCQYIRVNYPHTRPSYIYHYTLELTYRPHKLTFTPV